MNEKQKMNIRKFICKYIFRSHVMKEDSRKFIEDMQKEELPKTFFYKIYETDSYCTFCGHKQQGMDIVQIGIGVYEERK